MKINSLQKNGLLQLATLLFVVFLLFLLKKNYPISTTKFALDTQTQELLDQQKTAYLSKKSKPLKSYYVNTITDYSGYQLGLSTEQIDRLLAYQKTNKTIYTLAQFKKVTQINTLQLNTIKNKLRFPKKQLYTYPKKNSYTKNTINTNIKRYNINTITSKQLIHEFKLPSFIAERIIKFRYSLNGFNNINQIDKVYGIRSYQVDRIKKQCFIVQ